jgi:hypothetical protein
MILKVLDCEEVKRGMYMVKLKQEIDEEGLFVAKLLVKERMIKGEDVEMVALSKEQQILLKLCTHKAYANMLVKDLLKLSYSIGDSTI